MRPRLFTLRCADKKRPRCRDRCLQVVGDEGFRVRPRPHAPRFGAFGPSRATLENALAFPQLRALLGSNPEGGAQAKNGPVAGTVAFKWWAMRDSNPQPCACKAPALTVAPIAREG